MTGSTAFLHNWCKKAIMAESLSNATSTCQTGELHCLLGVEDFGTLLLSMKADSLLGNMTFGWLTLLLSVYFANAVRFFSVTRLSHLFSTPRRRRFTFQSSPPEVGAVGSPQSANPLPGCHRFLHTAATRNRIIHPSPFRRIAFVPWRNLL